MNNVWLAHHGILGQKWGVRRYQNPDGTLTDAGKKHYGKMSGEQIYKDLKKQVRNKRGEFNGSANKFMVRTAIGEHSKALIDEDNKKRKEWESSKEYKEWDKRVTAFERKYENADYVDMDKYDKEFNKLLSERPKQNWDTLSSAVMYSSKGRQYMNDYLNKGGKQLSLAYLKDLGYADEVAEEFVKKMIKANRTIGAI